LGDDLFKLTRGLYDRGYKGIEFVGDYRLTKNIFLAAEIGNENKTTDDDRLNFTTGSYLKVGFDYNAYENWLDMENIISIGLWFQYF
jgi:flagellar biosynthesis regulator FlaF